MAESTDVRWPRDWESDRDPITGEYWAFSPAILARDVRKVAVYVPLIQDGEPDIDGLLARLRLDPAEVERDRQRLAEALTLVERLRAALQSVLSIDDDYPLDPSGYDPDEYQRLRGIIDAARAALVERGGDCD